MQTLDELKQKNIKLIIHSDEEIDASLLKKQIESNGSLNDYNMNKLYKRRFPYFSDIVAHIHEYPLGKQVVLCYKHGEEVMPFCDFILANREKELELPNQLAAFYNHMLIRFNEIIPYTPEMIYSDYVIKKIDVLHPPKNGVGDLECEVGYRELGKMSIKDYWEQEIKSLVDDVDSKNLQKRLYIFRQDLNRSINPQALDGCSYGTLFVNLSNMLRMLHNQYQPRREMVRYSLPDGNVYVEDLDELIFTYDENLVKLIAQKTQDKIVIPLSNIRIRLSR